MNNPLFLPIKVQDNLLKHFGTQSNLAKELGVSQQFVSKWFNGTGKVPIIYALKIEKLTGGKIKSKQLLSDEKKDYLSGKK